MRFRIFAVVAGSLMVLTSGTQARAVAPPTAGCVGQQLSAYATAYGADLGATVASEARDPDSIGVDRLGDWVSDAARADRTDCPVD